MKPTMLKRGIIIAAIVLFGAWLTASILLPGPDRSRVTAWQSTVSPGELSSAHASLSNNCTACHTPTKGVEASNCIVCHANDQSLLQRQPTAFHAEVRSCVECHGEHQGTGRRPTQMNHAALADLGLRELASQGAAGAGARNRLLDWIGQRSDAAALPPGHRATIGSEAALSCAACHGKQDRHRGFFGSDCVQCHTTTAWAIPEFRHPLPSSTNCAQCHEAPPSHYMEHFKMISMKIAGQEHAQVNQCHLCHQTTSWNDIKGVGWYKHH